MLARWVSAAPLWLFWVAAIGLFGLLSGLASLLCHVTLEPSVNLSQQDGLLLLALGLGPLGVALIIGAALLGTRKVRA